MMRTLESQREAWRKIPVDDVGYLDGSFLASLPDNELRRIVARMETARYSGWRNKGGTWRRLMLLDDAAGLDVLDYGCGLGIEALQYAKAGARVSVADINQSSLDAASRVLRLHGFSPAREYLISMHGKLPGAESGQFDLAVMNGVLHHIEDPVPAAGEIWRVLKPGGSFRVMVYTDIAWRMSTGTEPPEDVTDHPGRGQFTAWGDDVGDWADWYNGQRLAARFGHLFTVGEWQYIGNPENDDPQTDGRYGIGVMQKQRDPAQY